MLNGMKKTAQDEFSNFWWAKYLELSKKNPLLSIKQSKPNRMKKTNFCFCDLNTANCWRSSACRPEGGILPYIRYIGMCRPIGWAFCAVLVWKRAYTLPILVWNRVWFSRELRYVLECMKVFIVSIPNEQEGKRNVRIRNGFEEFFICALI